MHVNGTLNVGDSQVINNYGSISGISLLVDGENMGNINLHSEANSQLDDSNSNSKFIFGSIAFNSISLNPGKITFHSPQTNDSDLFVK